MVCWTETESNQLINTCPLKFCTTQDGMRMVRLQIISYRAKSRAVYAKFFGGYTWLIGP